MIKQLLATAAATALIAGLAAPATANTIYFQMNPNLSGSGEARQVFVFGQAGVTGTVSNGAGGFTENFTLGASGFAVVDIPIEFQLTRGNIETKGFRVESSEPVSAYFLNRRSATTDMTYLIDGARLGTDHVIATYEGGVGEQVSAQAVQDNTTVRLRLPNGDETQPAVLNAGQTFFWPQTSGLTGARIISDKPVAVFSGNQCTQVGNVGACDHLVEQIPSVDKLSSSYLLAQTPRNQAGGNVYRAVATQDGTEVRQDGTLVATLNNGQFYEGRVVGGIELVASKPILVAQYLIGQNSGDNTDPAMTLVPGADQWLKSYVFAAPSGTADFPTDFVSIIIRTTDLGSLRLDGTAPDTASFQVLGSTAFSYGNIDVSLKLGAFNIVADSPFQLLLSGFDNFDSYFTYGGAAFSPGASPPPPPPPPPPTGVRVYWDGAGPANNSVVEGGAGTWTTASTNFTNEGGTENGINNPQPSTVIFGGTGGIVTVSNADGPVTVTGMTFNVDGYSIVGDPVTLSGETAEFTVNGGENTATIGAKLTGPSQLAKLGAGTLVLANATNDYAGGTLISGGTLRGVVGAFGAGGITNNANLVLDVATAQTLGNLLSGTGTVTKNGAGVLTIAGANPISGDFTVAGGGLVVTGTLGSRVLLNAGTLSGTGTIGGFVAATGTTVSPGPVVGTLTVTPGNAIFQTGSTYAVDVTSTGTSDSIVVNTGRVDVATGTTLRVTKTDAPRLVLGTRYTVASGNGEGSGRVGSFTTLTGDTRVSRFISVVQETDTRNIYLGVRQTSSFASAGLTPNQIAAATGSDNSGNGGLYTALAYLNSDAEAQGAFDQISGEIHASARGQTVQDSRFVREALSWHMQSPDETRKGLWMSAYGSWGNTDGDGNAARVKRDIGGFFMGFDALRGENWSVGVLAGYGRATMKVEDRFSRGTSDDLHIGAYAGFMSGNVIGSFSVAHMWRNLDTNRNVSFAGFTDTLTAPYKTNVTQVFGELAYRIDAGKVAVEPFAQAAYVDVSTAAIAEVGGAAKLTSRKASDGFFVTTLGARLKYGLPLGDGSFGVTAEAGWRHLGGGNETTPIDFNFGAGSTFSIAGAPFGRDVAALGLVLSGQVGNGVEIDFGYRGVVGSGVKDHGVRGGVIIRF